MYLKRERVSERKGEVSVLAHTVYSRINARPFTIRWLFISNPELSQYLDKLAC
jgi:hypothetical protein